jgi:hypothetical protein
MPNGKKTKKKRKSLLRVKVTENANLILVAFALAFVTWIFAKAGESEEATITIPVLVTPADPRIQVRVSPASFPVILRYPKDMQKSISSGNFHFAVDIAEMRDNLGLEWKSKSEPVTAKNLVANIRGARRVSLVQVGTQSNTVRVEVRWNAVPALVEPDLVGAERLPAGFQVVTPVRIIPREVWITGDPEALSTLPRDEVTSKIKLYTEKVNVGDRVQASLETVQIKLPRGVDIVQPASALAEVNLEIQETQTVREIRDVNLDFAAVLPDSVQLDYKEKTATVTVFGPQSLLQKIGPGSIEITLVRPAEEVPGTSKDVTLETRFAASVPEDVKSRLTIRSVEPKSIKVTYLAKPH